jgi:RNA polymerase sigma factor (sigma-70 family)
MEPWQARLLEAHGYLVGCSLASLGLSGDPEVEDLEQEARLALLLAVREFDPEAGYRFSSFAIPRVRGAVLEYRRSRCSWVRRTGQQAKAHVDAARVTLELRGEPLTEAALRALLADPRDYDRAAALPVLVPLVTGAEGELDAGLEDLPAEDPPLVEQVAARAREASIERAVKRLAALDRAVFRGRVQRGMAVREVARRLGIAPAEVTRRQRRALAQVRQFLNRVSTRLTENEKDFSLPEIKHMGRPSGRRFTQVVRYYADEVTRDMSRRLALFEGKSEAAVHRQAIREKFARVRREHPDDPRLSL